MSNIECAVRMRSVDALVSPAGQGRDRAGELQFEQDRRYAIGRQAAALAQGVNIARVVAEVREERVLRVAFFRLRGRRRGGRRLLTELAEHVLRTLDELCALLDQRVATLRQRRVDRSRNREHLSSLLRGKARS